MATKRTSRVGGLLKREVADILCREIRDPKVGFVTVSSVDVTSDLRTASIRVSVLGDEEHRQESLRCLNAATGFIQKALSSRVRLKRMPKLQFVLDTSIDYSMHIAQLLSELGEGRNSQERHEENA